MAWLDELEFRYILSLSMGQTGTSRYDYIFIFFLDRGATLLYIYTIILNMDMTYEKDGTPPVMISWKEPIFVVVMELWHSSGISHKFFEGFAYEKPSPFKDLF